MARQRRDGVFEAILGIIENLEPESETTYTIAAGGTQVIPKGIHIVVPGANTAIEVSPDGGTTWRSLPNGNGGMIVSDGKSVRLKNNSATAAEDSYVITLG